MIEIIHEDHEVDALWQFRHRFAPPHKRNQSIEFFGAFFDFISLIHSGYVPSMEDWNKIHYWKYMANYYRSGKDWQNISRHRKALEKRIQSAINLYHDIKENGMRDPLDFVYDGSLCLVRGNRRLVILKILGIKRADIRIEKRA